MGTLGSSPRSGVRSPIVKAIASDILIARASSLERRAEEILQSWERDGLTVWTPPGWYGAYEHVTLTAEERAAILALVVGE